MRSPSSVVTVRGVVLATLLLATIASASLAGPALDADKLYLRTGVVDTAAEPSVALNRAAEPMPVNERFVIQLDGPMTAERRAALDATGVVIQGYLPVNAFIVRLDNVAPGALDALGFVRWAGAYQDAWKLDPDIAQMQVAGKPLPQTAQQGADNTLKLTVTLFAGENLLDAVEQLDAIGATVLDADDSGDHGAVELRAPADLLPALQAMPAVQFVQPAGEITLRNDQTAWVIQSNVTNNTPIWDAGIHGEGQMGGLIDSGVKVDHCMFLDPEGDPFGPNHRKIESYFGSTTPDAHGTHTAGTFIGDHFVYDGSTFRNGMAYGARMTFRNYFTITSTNLYTSLEAQHNTGAHVHSNSWGNDGTTSYTNHCYDIDRFSWDYEDDLVVFAATNTSTLKTPENAKNVLAVEATNSPNSQEFKCFGGVGPTLDGRRKPEIFAPGCSIDSARHNSTVCAFTSLSGTSMAAPAIAGAGLLVRQYYSDGFYPSGAADANDGFVPSGALIKATLLNGTVDMTGITGYPNNTEGWGRLLLDNVLHLAGETRTLIVMDARRLLGDGLSTGEEATRHFQVVDDNDFLRVTLVWADYRAEINANPTPVNNLDLVVEGPGGVQYLGNVFSGGESTTGGAADSLNNVEQVQLFVPTPGSYTARVIGTTVQMDTQGFALVITGDVAELTPVCGDFDADGDVDTADFSVFTQCFGGSANPPAESCPPGADADCDNDGDVDTLDFVMFSQNYTGSL